MTPAEQVAALRAELPRLDAGQPDVDFLLAVVQSQRARAERAERTSRALRGAWLDARGAAEAALAALDPGLAPGGRR